MKPWLSDALLRTQTDERLVALTRAGHDRAFAAVVERYRRPLVGFARRIAPDSRAEDVVQQALTSAWAALAAGAEVSHLRGWLHQIVRHEAIRVARQEGRAVIDPLDAAPFAASDHDVAAASEERERLRRTLAGIAGLPERQREALVQTTLAGRSRGEVAAALGLSEGAVRQLVHRARSSLRTVATAITPLPLASWAAGAGAGSGPAIAELAAGAGGATAVGALMKTGTAVLATGAIATGVTVTRARRGPDAPVPAKTVGVAADDAGVPRGGAGAASPAAVAPDRAASAGRRDSVASAGGDDRGRRSGRDDAREARAHDRSRDRRAGARVGAEVRDDGTQRRGRERPDAAGRDGGERGHGRQRSDEGHGDGARGSGREHTPGGGRDGHGRPSTTPPEAARERPSARPERRDAAPGDGSADRRGRDGGADEEGRGPRAASDGDGHRAPPPQGTGETDDRSGQDAEDGSADGRSAPRPAGPVG